MDNWICGCGGIPGFNLAQLRAFREAQQVVWRITVGSRLKVFASRVGRHHDVHRSAVHAHTERPLSGFDSRDRLILGQRPGLPAGNASDVLDALVRVSAVMFVYAANLVSRCHGYFRFRFGYDFFEMRGAVGASLLGKNVICREPC